MKKVPILRYYKTNMDTSLVIPLTVEGSYQDEMVQSQAAI